MVLLTEAGTILSNDQYNPPSQHLRVVQRVNLEGIFAHFSDKFHNLQRWYRVWKRGFSDVHR
jgi:hypothetical protein